MTEKFRGLLGTLTRTETHIPETGIESIEAETSLWEQAYLGRDTDLQDRSIFVASFSLREDTSKKAYGFVITDPRRATWAEIPMSDLKPHRLLRGEAYMSPIFHSGVARESFRKFAAHINNRAYLAAMLNRNSANVDPGQLVSWFQTTFGFEQFKRYGKLYPSSFGGKGDYGYEQSATIINEQWDNDGVTDPTEAAVRFAGLIKGSIPHIEVKPIAVSQYLVELDRALMLSPENY